MDFAVCPACGQSVLDDEAENCPFCNASMKAKPGAKPNVVQPAAKAPAKPATKGPAVKGPAKSGDDDLPFNLSETAPTAIPASRVAGKGRTLKVTCPMCDQEGYVPPTAAGKDVKCANPACMAPIFTAPVPKVEAPPPPPKKKSGNLVMLSLITTVVVGGIGAAVWFFAGVPTEDVPQVKPIDPSTITQTTTPTPDVPANGTTPEPATPAPTTTAVFDPAALTATLLQESQQAALLTGGRNRSKPLCRRAAAEAYALSGDVAGARKQIDALVNVGQQLPFYQVTPWVEVFWREQRGGNPSGASEALTNALKASEKLPNRGRDQLDAATRLAHALVVAGRDAEARTLIAAHQTNELDGELSALFLWLATDPRATKVDELWSIRPATIRETPQAAAVAALCVLSGHADQGLGYAKSWPEEPVKIEALTAWCEATVWRTPDQAESAVTAALDPLPVTAKVMAWARAARVARVRGHADLAKRCVAAADTHLATLTPPENVTPPDTRSLVKTRPMFDATWSAAAAAAGELAIAQQEVTGEVTLAGRTLDTALGFTRGMGPATQAITALVAQADRLGPGGLRNQLKAELELRTDDDARQAAGVYRRALTDLETAAKQRLDLQTRLLFRATQEGLERVVWPIVAQVSALEDPLLQEPLLGTEIAPWLVERFRAAKLADEEKTLLAARSVAKLPALVRPTEAVFDEQFRAGDYAAAWKTLTAKEVRSDLREALALEGTARLALEPGREADLWKWVGPMTDVVLREQAVDWGAWLATRRGAAETIAGHRKSLHSATEICGLIRGVIAGLQDQAATQ